MSVLFLCQASWILHTLHKHAGTDRRPADALCQCMALASETHALSHIANFLSRSVELAGANTFVHAVPNWFGRQRKRLDRMAAWFPHHCGFDLQA